LEEVEREEREANWRARERMKRDGKERALLMLEVQAELDAREYEEAREEIYWQEIELKRIRLTWSFRLSTLPSDLIESIARRVCDPLCPHVAVSLSSTCHSLRLLMDMQLAALRVQFTEAKLLFKDVFTYPDGRRGWSIVDLPLGQTWQEILSWHKVLRGAEMIHWPGYGTRLSASQWGSVGAVLGRATLLELHGLDIAEIRSDTQYHIAAPPDTQPDTQVWPPWPPSTTRTFGDEGLTILLSNLVSGLAHTGNVLGLRTLNLSRNAITDVGMISLASALASRSLPLLERLVLHDNRIGDDGMAALAPALRDVCKLTTLVLHCNQLGERGVSSLMTIAAEALEPSPPARTRPLCRLKQLDLDFNRLGDGGCATLTAAITGGLMPALVKLSVGGEGLTMSHKSIKSVQDALAARGVGVQAWASEPWYYDPRHG